ncbi:MAG: hypothetical protein ABJN40_14690 [Sneathiella sp.]
MTLSSGKAFRLGRIINPDTNRSVSVAFDHGLDVGPMPGITDARGTMAKLVEGGADAVLISPGIARLCQDQLSPKTAPSFIMRMDWTNMWRPLDPMAYEEGRTCLIARVEDAVRLGADAVLSFMFMGYDDPDVEIAEMQKTAELTRACEQYGIPHIIEPMCRGLKSKGKEMDGEYIAFVCRMAVEMGADALKADYSGSAETYRQVVEACPVPILIAGGPKADSPYASYEMVEGAIEAGAAGVLLGRNIIQAPDPAAALRAIRGIVHENMDATSAVQRHLN